MSVLDFISGGGMAQIGGDLDEQERKTINEITKRFGELVKNIGRGLQVPASLLTIRQASFLFVGKDIENWHIVFALGSGENNINYRNLTEHGKVPLQAIVHQVRIEIGDVIWAFSMRQNASSEEQKNTINSMAAEYVNSVLQSQKRPSKKPSDESIDNPEIASGLEKIRKDYPDGTKLAFIIMRFENTHLHEKIVEVIKKKLKQHSIIGIRADDKEYMDDLFSNVKVYIHSCDFAIAVFDRISSEDFNPNVSLEVGYLFGLKKPVLLLKDQTLRSLNTDLTGKIYRVFDTTRPEETIPGEIEKWLKDKGFMSS